MDIEKALEATEKEYSEKKETIKLISVFAREVDFISEKHVFFKERTYFENMELLHLLAERYGKYTLSHYFVSGSRFSIVYKFDKFNVSLFCTDNDFAVNKVSNGKCHIKSETKKTDIVVCDLVD